MDCLLVVLQLCFFDPSNLYVTATYDYAFSTSQPGEISETTFDGLGQPRIQVTRELYYAAHDYGRVAIGWSVYESKTLTFDIGLSHQSSPSTRSDGYEAAYAGFTWRPFR
jgi:hypothetical protein